MAKYTVGIDYGTLSARAVLVDVETGNVAAESSMDYPHGVISRELGGKQLPAGSALQYPQDYVDCAAAVVRAVLSDSCVSPRDIIGLCVDVTACTMLPVDSNGQPLCERPEFAEEPHAYLKLWKHHCAENEAREMTRIAAERGEPWLPLYGAKISSEWMYPKIWNILNEAPEIYAAADRFLEAADYLSFVLTGEYSQSACFAGYKAFEAGEMSPEEGFFAALDPRLANVRGEKKLNDRVLPLGSRAGRLCAQAAALLGLEEGTAVAVPIVDAHSGVLAANIRRAGQLLMIMGTSTCHMMVSEELSPVPGICGVVKDGILPGLYAYEAGQACVGDHFAWFAENCCPAAYAEEAKTRGIDMHRLLTEKASALRPGESGLVALDWWNGCRSILVDSSLTGCIFGMTLATKPEEIYRALIEATAFGSRVIVENFNANGVPVREIFATGGIARKNPMLMQIYADILNMPVNVCGASQGPALGSAILAAAAAGASAGGYDTVYEAMEHMSRPVERVYSPIGENAAVYNELFEIYRSLYMSFGRDEASPLKKLRRL